MESSDDLDQVLDKLKSIEGELDGEKTTEEKHMNQDNLRSPLKETQEKGGTITNPSEIPEEWLPTIQVYGVGGGGNNTVSTLQKRQENIETIAVNTDANQLRNSNADEYILLGKNICGGHGAGNQPEKGKKAAKESTAALKEKISEGDLIFLTCGLGGGTGTGATPYIAKIANSMEKTVVAVCTLPFNEEGEVKKQNAEWGLEQILNYADTKIIISNQNLLDVAPNVGIIEAFNMVDNVLVKAIKGISDLITDKDSVINVDYEDVRKTLSSGGTSLIGIGEVSADEENRGKALIKDAIENPLLCTNPKTAENALVNIYGGNSLSLQEATDIVGSISQLVGKEEEMIWGLTVKEEFSNILRAVVMLSGIRPNFLDDNGNVDIGKVYSFKSKQDPFENLEAKI